MHKDFERMESLEETLGVEIISYGLAPNPNGYCFEVLRQAAWNNASEAEKKEFNLLCETAKQGFF